MVKHSLLVLLAVAFAVPAFAQDHWPEFRGPSADGSAGTAVLPAKIDESVISWKTPIRGKGWSSPVIWGDQIWVTTATPDGKKMWAICVSKQTGKIVHDLLLLENKEPAFCHDMNSYASPTPVVSEGRVWVHFGSYGTFCLDSQSGKIIWSRKDLPCDHWRGPASSPILYKGNLIVALDGHDDQYVVALDAISGKTVWKRDRNIDYHIDDGDWKKAYGTGRVFQLEGKDVLVYPSASATVAYEAETGKELWKYYYGGMNVSARPLLTASGLLIVTNGMGKMFAIEPKGNGDITKQALRWETKKSVARKSSQVIVEGNLYMANEKGVISCLDVESGDSVWQKRVGGSFAASPVFANGLIYFFDMEGAIYVVRPGESFDLVSNTTLDDGFMASPAVSGNAMFLRSRSHLFRIESKGKDDN